MVESDIKVMYIRHAQSLFNLWELYVDHKLSEDEVTKYAKDVEEMSKFTHKFDPLLLDPRLSLKGQNQAKSTEIYSKMPIKYVFVSPLRRALETCDAIFSRHPNISNIRFIVHPLLREILNITNDMFRPLKEAKASH